MRKLQEDPEFKIGLDFGELFLKVYLNILYFFFCSGREKCIYALTDEPMFETKNRRSSVHNWTHSTKQNTDSNSLPIGHPSFVALIYVPLVLTFKLRPLTLSYSPHPHNHNWFVFHTKQLQQMPLVSQREEWRNFLLLG